MIGDDEEAFWLTAVADLSPEHLREADLLVEALISEHAEQNRKGAARTAARPAGTYRVASLLADL